MSEHTEQNKDWAAYQETLGSKLELAIQSAPFEDEIELSDPTIFWVNNEPWIRLEPTPVRPHEVYLTAEESHLFPWLVDQVYQRIAIAEDRLAVITHETKHLEKALTSPTLRSLIGFSFFKIRGEEKEIIVEPNVRIEGEVSLATFQEIITAPDTLSADDEQSSEAVEMIQKYHAALYWSTQE